MRWKILIVTVLTIILTLSMASMSKADTIGIDVSRWQGEIDWNSVSGHAGFAIIKAGGSDGEFYVDSQFNRNRDEARRLAIPRGYYYFAGGGNPVQEAEHFASIVGPLQPGEVVALDFEIDHTNPVGYSLQFVQRAETLLGVKPLVYTYMNKVWTNDWQPVVSNGNQLWGAIYDEDPAQMPHSGAWPGVMIKQFSSSGTVPGISANSVDLNVFKYKMEDFLSLGFTPKPPPEPAKPAPPKIEVNPGLQEITETMLPTGGVEPANEVAAANEVTAEVISEPSALAEASPTITEEVASGTSRPEDTADIRAEWLDSQAAPGGKVVAVSGSQEATALDPRTPIGSVVTGVLFPLKQIVAIAGGGDDEDSQEQAADDSVEASDAHGQDETQTHEAGGNQKGGAAHQKGGDKSGHASPEKGKEK